MARTLWAFGCSHTLGHGLPDCVTEDNQPIPQPSKYAWPARLAELCNLPVNNCGAAGVGCAGVWNDVVNNSNIASGDIVIVLWPCWETRPDVLLHQTDARYNNHPKHIRDIRSWITEDGYYFMNYYSAYNEFMHYYLYANHVYHHCVNRNIKIIQTAYRRDSQISGSQFSSADGKHTVMSRPTFDIGVVQGPYFSDDCYKQLGLAQDGSHLGVQAHQKFAEDLFPTVQIYL